MRKFSAYLLAALFLAVLFKFGCSDINSSETDDTLMIKSVIPAYGGYGAQVIISGSGLSPLQKITFNGLEANAISADNAQIVTRVPYGATSGPIGLIVDEEVLAGPVFTVNPDENLYLIIDSITPLQVHPLDTIKITGVGFEEQEYATEEMKIMAPLSGADYKNASQDKIGGDKIQTKISIDDKLEWDGPVGVTQLKPSINLQQNNIPKFASQDMEEPVRVFINEAEIEIISQSDTVLFAVIPEVAQTGLVMVTTARDTVTGPELRVLRHSISNISPTSGLPGSTVEIHGQDFSTNPAKNVVRFAGEAAEVISATETKLTVVVPEMASSGTVSVAINGIVKEGPTYMVAEDVEEFPLIVQVTTNNASPGHDGYNLIVSGQPDRWIAPNTSEEYFEIHSSTVTVQLDDGPETCYVVNGNNPRTVMMNEDGPTEVSFELNCISDLLITELNPDNGTSGDEITIIGEGFGTQIADVRVWFTEMGMIMPHKVQAGSTSVETIDNLDFDNFGIEAEIISVSETEIKVKVPEGAGDGTLIVAVFDGDLPVKMGESPIFAVEYPALGGALTVHVTTNNASPGHDGYNLIVSGQPDRWIAPNTSEEYFEIHSSTVTVQLDDGPETCYVVNGNNPRTVMMSEMETTEVSFELNCISELFITELNPDNGTSGDEITIIGEDFGSHATDVKVWFAEMELVMPHKVRAGSAPVESIDALNYDDFGVEAEIISVSETEIKVKVPEGAGDGTLIVAVFDGDFPVRMGETPEFIIEYPALERTLTVQVTTNNASPGHDGYNLEVTDENDRWIYFNTTETYLNIVSPVVSVALSEGPENCVIDGPNPRVVEFAGMSETVSFLVNCVPEIFEINPDTAPIGSMVSISGSDFNYETEKNKVFFSGDGSPVEAEISESTRWEIIAEVPEGAVTGPITVISDGVSAEGPVFTVEEPAGANELNIHIETNDGPLGHDGYGLLISGPEGDNYEWIFYNETYTYTDLPDGDYSIELSDGPPQCMAGLVEDNPQVVTISGGTTDVYFTFNCIPPPVIHNIEPDHGPVGTLVTINGENFSPVTFENQVWFNSAYGRAEVLEASTTMLMVVVPDDAQTGAIEIGVYWDFVEGPVFTVEEPMEDNELNIHIQTNDGPPGHDGYGLLISGPEGDNYDWIFYNETYTYTDLPDGDYSIELSDGPPQCMAGLVEENPQFITLSGGTTDVYFTFNCIPPPVIDSIDPNSAPRGEIIRLYGQNFNSIASENQVWFSGSDNPAEIIGASTTMLEVKVPEDANTGNIWVEVYWYYEQGPVFTVEEPAGANELNIHIETNDGPLGHDGYGLQISGPDGDSYEWIFYNETYTYTDLPDGDYSIELQDGPPQCMAGLVEDNPQFITLSGGTTDVYFTFNCIPPPVIDSINPDNAYPGETVILYGQNFNSIASENHIWFSGSDVTAEVISASTTMLEVIVPEDANTGNIWIEVYWYYEQGPIFTVITEY